MENLLISDVAKEVDVESHVLRYWEEKLQLPIRRNELGHRYYTEEDVERFRQIKNMKDRGLQLKAVKMILKHGSLRTFQISGNSQIAAEVNETHGMAIEILESHPIQECCSLQHENCDREIGIHGLNGHRHMKGIMIRQKEENESEGREAQIIDGSNGIDKTTMSADKILRLKGLLKDVLQDVLEENNQVLSREIRESVLKELDYQFRMQEEREATREHKMDERNEEHYRKMDELLREKSAKPVKRGIRRFLFVGRKEDQKGEGNELYLNRKESLEQSEN